MVKQEVQRLMFSVLKFLLWSVEILGYIKNGVCLEDEFGVPMNS